MRRDALEQGERVAHPVGGRRRELRRVEEVVDADDLLEQRRHDTWSCQSLCLMVASVRLTV